MSTYGTPSNQPIWPPAPQTHTTTPAPRRGTLTGAETFWYVLGCIGFAASYFAKIPTKKALAEYGYGTLTGAETFWYVLMNIGFGAGYFLKVPVKKALTEAAPLGR